VFSVEENVFFFRICFLFVCIYRQVLSDDHILEDTWSTFAIKYEIFYIYLFQITAPMASKLGLRRVKINLVILGFTFFHFTSSVRIKSHSRTTKASQCQQCILIFFYLIEIWPNVPHSPLSLDMTLNNSELYDEICGYKNIHWWPWLLQLCAMISLRTV
jgi:hypothetical protein